MEEFSASPLASGGERLQAEMMPTRSAGILCVRRRAGQLEFLLVHPGGPFWERKDEHAWSLPKGIIENEDPLAAARREFAEETGGSVQGSPVLLGSLTQPSGKVITAWAVEQDFDLSAFHSNTFDLEWPPHSGRIQSFPEVDRAGWFPLETARQKILPGQMGFLDEAANKLSE